MTKTVSYPGASCEAPAPDATRLRCVQDFAFFVRFVMGNTAVDSRYGFHRELCKFVSRPRRARKTYALLMAPRGFLKSTIGNLDNDIWWWLVNPNERIFLMCGTEDKAQEYASEIVSKITVGESSARLRWIAPDVFGSDPAKDLKFKAGKLWIPGRSGTIDVKVPSLVCAGEMSGTAGLHYTRYKFDDLVNDENYQSELMRDGTIKKFRDVMGTRKGHGSVVDIVDTIYHPQDLTQWIQHKDNGFLPMLDVFKLNGEIPSCWYNGQRPDGSGRYLPGEESWWPEEKPVSFLVEQKISLGPLNFAQQYLLHPSAEGSTLFDSEVVARNRYEQRYERDEYGEERLVLPGTDPLDSERRSYTFVMALDAVAKGTSARDYACALVGAWNDLGQLYLVDVYYERPKLEDFFEAVYGLWCLWQPRSVFMENTGAVAPIWDAIHEDQKQRKCRYPMHAMKRQGGDTGGKQKRIEATSPFVAQGRLLVPSGPKWERPLSEMENYRLGVKDQRDDFLDCFADIVAKKHLPVDPAKTAKAGEALQMMDRLAQAQPWSPRLGVHTVARPSRRFVLPSAPSRF